MKNSTSQDQQRTFGFSPLLCKEPRILILGTLPGGESLEHRQYYYSKSNRIWKVLCYLTGEPMPADYTQKKALLAKYHIVLWDYYESAVRPGSNDKDIREARPNDIAGFLTEHPTIKVIAINGYGKFRKLGGSITRSLAVIPGLSEVCVLRLPETSGGNANYGWGILENLAGEWKQIFK